MSILLLRLPLLVMLSCAGTAGTMNHSASQSTSCGVIESVYFDLGTTEIATHQLSMRAPQEYPPDSLLHDLARWFNANPTYRVCFVGCADASEETGIGERRAIYLKSAVTRLGVNADRIQVCPCKPENVVLTEAEIAGIGSEQERRSARGVNARVAFLALSR